MADTWQTQVPQSNSYQNQSANNVPLPPFVILSSSSPPMVVEPGAVHPPSFASGAGSSLGDGGGNGGVEVAAWETEPYQFPFGATHITVGANEDILEKLTVIAREREVFVLGAHGTLSYVELCNRKDAPVANTVFQGNFTISSLEGNMVIPKENEPNRPSRFSVLVVGEDGQFRGGPVRKLISKSQVQLVISSMSRGGIESWARDAYGGRINPEDLFPASSDKKKKEYLNEVYENTLMEINERNTFSWRCAQLKE